MRNIRDGITILLKYDHNGDISAEHDEIVCGGGAPADMTEGDRKELKELGWHWDEENGWWVHYV